jgi:hypothetical protein
VDVGDPDAGEPVVVAVRALDNLEPVDLRHRALGGAREDASSRRSA